MSDYRTRSLLPVVTGPYPELATDLQPQMMAVACYCVGISKIRDIIYPYRYGIVAELEKMGADINMKEDFVYVTGKETLIGAVVKAPDLRGGAALVIAALGACGYTLVYGYPYIQRGYEDIIRDLHFLGADIEWKEDAVADVPN